MIATVSSGSLPPSDVQREQRRDVDGTQQNDEHQCLCDGEWVLGVLERPTRPNEERREGNVHLVGISTGNGQIVDEGRPC